MLRTVFEDGDKIMRKMAKFLGAAVLVASSLTAPVAVAKADDAAVVQAHVNAYRTGNLDAFVATFAKDARVEANGMVAVGHAQIRAFYALNFKKGAPKLTVVDSGMSGPNVYITISYTFTDGREVCCSYSEYTIEDGKITQLVAVG